MTPRDLSPTRGTRLLLYCHDSYGLGHLRRTLTLAESLTRALPEVRILVATGSPCATQFPLPDGVDLLKLPSVTKDDAGRYVPRSLGIGAHEMIRLRGRLLLECYLAFEPELVLVDNKPLGMEGELAELLDEAHRRGTRTVLGIRDIIDEPVAVAREWGVPAVRRALVSRYDRVCVYGTPEVFDPRVEYPIPRELRERVELTGYVVRPPGPLEVSALPRRRPRVLVTVGGGEDGAERIERYLDLLEAGEADWDSTIVTGPLLPGRRARKIKRRARLLSRVDVHSFHSDLPRLFARSDAVLSMAGYNTVAEILQSGVRAVLWPRTRPRREQLLRASRMQALGLLECVVQPGPGELESAIRRALEGGPADARRPLLTGCERVCEVISELLIAERRALSTEGVR